MKKNVMNLLTILAFAVVISGCKKKADEAATSEAEEVSTATEAAVTYAADLTGSVIEWKGFKPTGTHNGNIMIKGGQFSINDGAIESGSFTIDMNSIVNLDIPADKEMNGKLVGHLKSADFFDVEKYPEANFEVTGVETVDGKTMLSGNLKLKEKENKITFPVSMTTEGDQVTLSSETFTIDRSKWDVKYGSKSFFDDLGDKFINDDIELKITVKANKS